MPFRISPGERVIQHNAVTMIRVIGTLKDRVASDLTKRVKSTMLEKGASYAESDLAMAALRQGSTKGSIDPHRLYQLVHDGKITIGQFLECVSVKKEPLGRFLPGEVVDGLCSVILHPEPSLVTEFKEGVELDVDELAIALAGQVNRAVPIKAA